MKFFATQNNSGLNIYFESHLHIDKALHAFKTFIPHRYQEIDGKLLVISKPFLDDVKNGEQVQDFMVQNTLDIVDIDPAIITTSEYHKGSYVVKGDEEKCYNI